MLPPYDTILTIPNANNKLAQQVFLHIHQPPKPGTVMAEVRQKTFRISQPGQYIYCQLTHWWQMPISRLCSIYTLAADGVMADTFIRNWQQQYPDATPDTFIAVYAYFITNRVKF